MFTIKFNTIDLDYNNCIYSNKQSRPSKSIIDCNLYKEFIKLNLSLDILNEYSYLKLQNKTIEYFLLREIINLLKLNIKYCNVQDYDNLSLCFNSIIINEMQNFNIVYCLEKEPNIKLICQNIDILIGELQLNDLLIINFIDLYTYTSAELLIILSNLFEKIKVYYCKLLKQNIILCFSYKNNPKITVFLKNILKNVNNSTQIRQFGIFINNNLQQIIKKHNSEIFHFRIIETFILGYAWIYSNGLFRKI